VTRCLHEICHVFDDVSFKNTRSVCTVCADLLKSAKDQHLKVKGPVRLPTKILTHTGLSCVCVCACSASLIGDLRARSA
jgi:hypothetical protein